MTQCLEATTLTDERQAQLERSEPVLRAIMDDTTTLCSQDSLNTSQSAFVLLSSRGHRDLRASDQVILSDAGEGNGLNCGGPIFFLHRLR